MKRKKVLKAIRKEAVKIPPETYFAIDLFYQPKWDDKEQEWKRGVITSYPVNHYRRMKKIYDKWGLGAVKAYILIKLNNKKNEENSINRVSGNTVPFYTSTKEG